MLNAAENLAVPHVTVRMEPNHAPMEGFVKRRPHVAAAATYVRAETLLFFVILCFFIIFVLPGK